MNLKFSAFVVNMDKLGAIYNTQNPNDISAEERENVGAWIKLPVDPDTLGAYVEEAVGNAGQNGYRIYTRDYSLDSVGYEDTLYEENLAVKEAVDKIAEHFGFDTLFDISLDEYDIETLDALIDAYDDIERALDNLYEVEVMDAIDEVDFAHEWLEQEYDDLDYELRDYFDYQQFGYDTLEGFMFYHFANDKLYYIQ